MEANSRVSILRVALLLVLLLPLVCFQSMGQIPVGQFDTTKTATIDTLPAFKGKRVISIDPRWAFRPASTRDEGRRAPRLSNHRLTEHSAGAPSLGLLKCAQETVF